MNWVGGEWTSGSGTFHDVRSPYTGQSLGRVYQSDAGDVDRAVQAATKAAREWALIPIKERSQVMYQFRNILLRDIETIAKCISLESGKRVAEGKAGMMKGIEVLEFALSLQNLQEGGRMEVSRGVNCEYRREPLGVVAAITPFNFPAMVPMWMLPIAIVLGNAFVWKPSDKTPFTSLAIATAAEEAGIPKGILTIVQGGQATVESILDHPGVASVGFVGSSAVARSVYRRAALAGKKVLALGGAKNPIILMPDADLEMASRGIVDSFTGCAGQRCMAASLLILVEDEAKRGEKILEEVVRKASQIRLGQDMGAIISEQSVARLNAAIERASQVGAKILLDGRNTQAPTGFEAGYWLGPTVIDHVKPGSEAACDELFGPVMSVVRVKTLSEALEIERASPYGNAASVFTSSGAVAQRVAESAMAGMVGVNIGVPVPREPFSFGGTKDSKFGSGDITGMGSLNLWSQMKKITTKWSVSSDQNWMS